VDRHEPSPSQLGVELATAHARAQHLLARDDAVLAGRDLQRSHALEHSRRV
jgi:hypothetical protein